VVVTSTLYRPVPFTIAVGIFADTAVSLLANVRPLVVGPPALGVKLITADARLESAPARNPTPATETGTAVIAGVVVAAGTIAVAGDTDVTTGIPDTRNVAP
jgi:hypothetical protein